MLFRLAYCSRIATDLSFPLVKSIIEKSQTNNRRDDLTGLLVLCRNHFFQVLEGDSRKINETYQRILLDDRHDNIHLLYYDSCPYRIFGEWSMHGLDIQKLSLDQQDMLNRKYGLNEQEQIFPRDPELVKCLAVDLKYLCKLM